MMGKNMCLRLSRFVAGFWLMHLAASSFAEDFHECVGRYELTLPSKVEVATTKFTIRKKEVGYAIQFSNGDPAPLSSFMLEGNFRIANGMSNADYLRVMSQVRSELKEYKIDVDFPAQKGERDTDIFAGDSFGEFYLHSGDTFVTFHTTDSVTVTHEQSAISIRTRLLSMLSNLTTRELGEIPKGPGICLPSLFISNQTEDTRKIGVTFRLTEHPDLTVFLLDDTSRAKANLTSLQRNEFVWTYSGLGKEVKLAHDPFPFHTVELDGRKGVASFGTITRGDGTTDYGYLVTVQGDPKAAVDAPDLTLLVERTAKNAKGKPPVSPDELKQIAKFIAGSVKRLPVQ